MKTILFGINPDGEKTGLYCGKQCAKESHELKTTLVNASLTVLDESNDNYWYDTDDDCRMPQYGHTCCCCGDLVWDDSEIV